jgi:predicted CxxxxCH...CXXCH cytochrome family protein
MSSGSITFYDYTSNQSLGSTYAYACTVCHPMYAAGKHRNGTYGDIDLSSDYAGVGGLRKLNKDVLKATGGGYVKGAGTFTCTAVYCHSSGSSTSTIVYRTSPNWYGPSPANRCGMCHENPPTYASGGSSYNSHYVASSSMGDNGSGGPYKESGHMIGIHYRNNSKGNNRTGFLGFSSSGSKAHGNSQVATTMSCYLCHSGITGAQPNQIDTYAMYSTAGAGSKSSKFRCANCHTASTTTKLQPGVIVDTQKHINGVKDVKFAPLADYRTKAQLTTAANALGWNRVGSYKADNSYDVANLASMPPYDPVQKTCLTSCHVMAPGITWGGKLKCNSCHVNQ